MTDRFEHLLEVGNLDRKEYQLQGVAWCLNNEIKENPLHNVRGGFLADEMGLGKTVQVVGFLNYLFERFHIRGPFLIVAPVSTLPHWQREFERFTGDNLYAVVYHGEY